MAWQVGPFTVGSGRAVRIAFWWDSDPGVQAIQVLPTWGTGGGTRLSTAANLELTNLSIENQPANGRGGGPSGDRIVYFITVTHLGVTSGAHSFESDPAEFFIRGGEV